jgi:hypothetical protein
MRVSPALRQALNIAVMVQGAVRRTAFYVLVFLHSVVSNNLAMPKSTTPPCPMLKEYLSSLKPTGPAARELNESTMIVAALVALGSGLATDNLWVGFGAFFLVTMILLTISSIRVNPRNAAERLQLDSYRAAKRLKGKLLDDNNAKHIEPAVLAALESAARSAMAARHQLLTLPTSLNEIQDNAMRFIDASMLLAMLAAKPLIRRDEQSRKDFEAVCQDKMFVASVIGKIAAKGEEIAEIEREAGQYQQTNSLGDHLREALLERQRAEAELEGNVTA